MWTGTTAPWGRRAVRRPAGRTVAVALLVVGTACGGDDDRGAAGSTVATGETAVAAPATPAPPSLPWAQEAVEWFEARDEAARLGTANLLRFLAPVVVHDGVARTQDEYEAHLQRDGRRAIRESPIRARYLDTAGALLGRGFRSDVSDYLTALEIDHTGVTTGETEANAASGHIHTLPGPVTLDAFARAYLDAWTTADDDALRSLYSPRAVLVDSLQRVELAGRESIVAHARAQVSPGTSLASGETGGREGRRAHPDVFSWRNDAPSNTSDDLHVFILYTAENGDGCPGAAAVALRTSAGRIVRERRYHEIDSVRRCWETRALPDGWWTGLRAPAPYEDVLTGTVRIGGQLIEIHNGTAALDRLVQWAMGRFEAADLAAPSVTSVTFDQYTHAPQCSHIRYPGLTVDLGDSIQLFVCLDQDDACEDEGCTRFAPRARLLVLHELAHAWMYRHLDGAAQRAFMDRMGVQEWSSPDVLWDDRGVERAAQVIAWGLTHEPLDVTSLDGDCRQLVDAFRLLTGAQPLRACCSPGTRGCAVR